MQSITTRVAQVFWGLAIIALDINAGRIDVLPDFVGYILVALGAAGLVGWSAHFQTARRLSWVLVGFPVALLLFSGALHKVVSLVHVVLDGALVWFLLGGVIAFAESKSRKEWASRAATYRRAYVSLQVVAVLTILIAPALPGLARFVGYVTMVATLVVMAVIVYLFYQVKGEAAGEAASSTPSNPFAQTEASTPAAHAPSTPAASVTSDHPPTQVTNSNPPAQTANGNPPAQSEGDTKQAA